MLDAWINNQLRIISFHEVDGAEHYSSKENEFWDYIMKLAFVGYKLQ